MSNIKVALVSLWYPMSISRYFERALLRRPDVDLKTIGPFTGTYIPWGGGMHLPQKYAIPPMIELPKTRVPAEAVQARLHDWKPDVWIQVGAEFFLSTKPSHGINCIVATDSHVVDYDPQRKVADYFFNMHRRYRKEMDDVLPYAYDPECHRMHVGPKQYDVVFLGIHYPQRNAVVNQLKRKGLDVHYTIGPAYEEAMVLYGKARASFNWPSHEDLNARYFELAAMGVPSAVKTIPHLDDYLVAGEHYLPFESEEQAAEQVEYLVRNPDEASEMGRRAHEVIKPHTYDARVTQLLGTVGVL